MPTANSPDPTDPAVRRRLRQRQIGLLGLLVTGYMGYYLCRSNLSVCMTMIAADLARVRGGSVDDALDSLGGLVSLGIIAYALGKLAWGTTTDLLGGRRIYLGGLVGAALATLLFASAGALPLMTLAWLANRAIQAGGWLGMVKLVSRWFPFTTHGAVMAVLSLSFLLGDGLSRQFMAALIGAGLGWRPIFLVGSAVVGVLFVINAWLVRESPVQLGLPEPEARPDNVFQNTAEPTHESSWLAIIQPLVANRAFWCVGLLSVGFTLVRETLNTWTPTYLESIGLTKQAAAAQSAWFPYLGAVSVLAAGIVSDRLGPTGRARILVAGLAIGASLFLWLATSASSTGALPRIAVIAGIALAILGPYSYLAGAVALDFGGKRGSATASGLVDFLGYLGAMLAGKPVIQLARARGWDDVFLAMAGVCLVSCAVGLALWFVQAATARKLRINPEA